MRSSKSRSRSKSNRNNNRTVGNIVNRVFDSSGPEGKVRGTPQQIIDKYNQLARDAQLSNDRVAAENFQQHAEHYLRMLSEAQREQDQRREEQDRQNRERQAERDRERAARQERESNDSSPEVEETAAGEASAAPDVLDLGDDSDSNLVETPENKAAPEDKPKPKRTRSSAPRKPRAKKSDSEGGDQPPAPEAA
ncbi:DUF4167 domain-containing protein [Thalassobius vesicularis]|uniref:DUF4167 domain-containing protein n=1 Tax=Thalassobius vesicularis TaxID=1294297 RepID=A0A4V3UYY0_9RHOB|nr:DUF4167 domain-containing protein [Thalassobius vesicularis]THD73474.1 DUF4167 domain-containing protein [Thalassobius vesicularis]